MAEKENTAVEKSSKASKPGVFSRIRAWFKSLVSESKKIVWADAKSVRRNTIIVIVCVIVISIAIGIADFLLSNAIVGLQRLF